MPAPSRWMIRASLIYLLIGFTLGAALLASKAYPSYSAVWLLLPIHIEVMIFGWIIQLTMGTAYWILPRFLKGESRGDPLLSKLMVVALNAGIILNVLSYLEVSPYLDPVWGRCLEVVAVVLFVNLHWNRAVSYR